MREMEVHVNMLGRATTSLNDDCTIVNMSIFELLLATAENSGFENPIIAQFLTVVQDGFKFQAGLNEALRQLVLDRTMRLREVAERLVALDVRCGRPLGGTRTDFTHSSDSCGHIFTADELEEGWDLEFLTEFLRGETRYDEKELYCAKCSSGETDHRKGTRDGD